MRECVRIQAGPCSTIEIGRGTMEIRTKGEDPCVDYQDLCEDLVEYVDRERLTSIPPKFGRRDPRTTMRLVIQCKVCTVELFAHHQLIQLFF